MRRYWTVGLIFLLLLAVIVGRLAYLTLIEGEELQAIAEQQRTRSLDYYQYARGDFYDALGRPLTSHEESCLVVFPAMIADPEQTAAALAELLALDEDLLCRRLTDENNRSIEPYVFKTGLSAEQTAAIESGQIRGVLNLVSLTSVLDDEYYQMLYDAIPGIIDAPEASTTAGMMFARREMIARHARCSSLPAGGCAFRNFRSPRYRINFVMKFTRSVIPARTSTTRSV